MKDEGLLVELKLVHRSGEINCERNTKKGEYWFGCPDTTTTRVFRNGRRLFKWQPIINWKGKTKELVFAEKFFPLHITKGMPLEIDFYRESGSRSKSKSP